MGMDDPACQGCRQRDARIAELEALAGELRARITVLEKQSEEQAKRLEEQAALIRDQARIIRDLSRKLQNVDLPKSGDRSKEARAAEEAKDKASKKTKPSKQPTGRKPGGQPGHSPYLKQLLPPERVNETVAIVPTACGKCGHALPEQPGPRDPEPTRFQVAELPDIKATITEYQGHARTCPCCGEVTQAAIPADIRAHSLGPELSALMGYLVGGCGLSKRRVEEVIESVFEVPVSLGAIAHSEQEMSAALQSLHEEALAAVREADVKHSDETGWKKAGQKRWLWVMATQRVVVFVIHRLHSAAVVMSLLGTVRGILCTDRWSGYDWWPTMQRQLCWSHLKRSFQKMVERGGKAQVTGDACLTIERQVFELWHRFRSGELSRDQLGDLMGPLMLQMLDILHTGERSRDGKTARICRRLIKRYPAIWTFVVEEGVEPTNNHGERVQRFAVLYRKNCFGCHSDGGCRFVERLLTVVQTLRLQKRSILKFLTHALIAHRTGIPKPSLLG